MDKRKNEYNRIKTIALKQAIETLVVTYNHEINNALAPIFLLTEQYLQKTVNDTELHGAIQIIFDSAQKIQNTIQEISQCTEYNVIPTLNYVDGIKMIKISQ